MCINILILLFILNVLVASNLGEISRNNINAKILGGSNATEGEYPSVCSLQTPLGHACGATIVNRKHLITAAHCVSNKNISTLSVFCGNIQLSNAEIRIKLSRIIVHPDYNSSTTYNDIAILNLEQSLNYSAFIQPAKLATRCFNDYPVYCKIVGWGRISFPGDRPDVLQELHSQTLTVKDCRERMASFKVVKRIQICALSKEGEGVCYGDSGGPLFVEGKLTGIVSWGRPCGLGLPDVYTRVACYSKWIYQTIENTLLSNF